MTQTPKLLDFQETPARRLAANIRAGQSTVLLGVVGSGKTYVACSAILDLLNSGDVAPADILDPEKVLFLMPTSCKIKFGRVATSWKLSNYAIHSYTEMNFKAGELYVDWQTHGVKTVNVPATRDGIPVLDASGQPVLIKTEKRVELENKAPQWTEEYFPEVLFLDESHMCKNEETIRTRILVEYIKCLHRGWKGCVVFCSGTPFSKLVETKAITMACLRSTEDTWKTKVRRIAGSHIDLTRPSEAGSERYKAELVANNAFIEIEGVKFAKRAFTKNKFIELDPERQRIYNMAFEEYQKVRAARGNDPLVGVIAVLVAMNKFRQIAEMLRSNEMGDFAHDRAYGDPAKQRQVIIASNFRQTLKSVRARLQAKGVPSGQIVELHGELSATVKQANVDIFQAGGARFMLMTLKTGGVGLSLDHDGSHPDQLPREVILPPTWSPIELTQGLGRAHRVLTKSTTRQWIMWCKDTIEDYVAAKVEKGLRSLKTLMTRKVSWMSCYEQVEESTVPGDKEIEEMLFADTVEEEDGEQETFEDDIFDNMVEEEAVVV